MTGQRGSADLGRLDMNVIILPGAPCDQGEEPSGGTAEEFCARTFSLCSGANSKHKYSGRADQPSLNAEREQAHDGAAQNQESRIELEP